MTNYEKLKIVSKETIATVLTGIAINGINDQVQDAVCKSCRKHHHGNCMQEKDDQCCYPYTYETIAAWLDLED